MNCTQEPGLLIELINLGALPCFGIGLIGLLIIKLIVYMISRKTSEDHITDGDMMAIITAMLSIYFLAIFIGIGFFRRCHVDFKRPYRRSTNSLVLERNRNANYFRLHKRNRRRNPSIC